MRNLLKKALPKDIKGNINKSLKKMLSGSEDVNIHFSQSGEDIQVYNILRPNVNKNGTYVDVGAFHPTHLSNTHLLYMNGWRGLNLDATPGSMQAFNNIRPGDINLEQAVSDKEEELVFYEHTSRAESSFDITHTLDKKKDGLMKETRLKTKSLNTILSENNISSIDMLTVDAEGFDFRILNALDFDKYQPKLIVIEQVADDIEEIIESDIYKLLKHKNYKLVARTIVGNDIGSSIYQLKS